MAINILKDICISCRKCTQICPGNLIFFKENKAEIIDKTACWDCAACLKECPVQAIEMYLQTEIGGKGSVLVCENKNKKILWTIKKDKKIYEQIETDNGDIMP